MDSLDSRSLRYVDCFAQRFPRAGTVVYELTTLAGALLPGRSQTFTIKVAKGRQGGHPQHHVAVRQVDGSLRAEPDTLEIAAGDMVVWHTADAKLPGYVVRGKGAGTSFDSSALRDEAIFTHAFGRPGTYEWVDAHGSDVGGQVVVEAADTRDARASERWRAALAEGRMVRVSAKSVRPRKVEIVVGQTVFWAVKDAGGVSITDARLIPGDPDAPRASRPTR
jgi:plastocyanin